MSTGGGQGHRLERNGEFCATVGPVARTASIPIQSVNSADLGCMLAQLGFALAGSKCRQGDELPRNGPSCLCGIFFFFFFLDSTVEDRPTELVYR